MNRCVLPPVGWVCTRGDGHPGPCAARIMTLEEHLVKIGACGAAHRWVEEHGIRSMAEAWDKCPYPQWLLWALMEDFPKEDGIKIGAACLQKLVIMTKLERALFDKWLLKDPWVKIDMQNASTSKVFHWFMMSIVDETQSMDHISSLLDHLTVDPRVLCDLIREIYWNPYAIQP